MVKAFNNKYSTVILMRNRSLVEQTYKAFESFGIENVGRITGDYKEPNLITIGTVQSLHNFPNVAKTKALIVDEVHLLRVYSLSLCADNSFAPWCRSMNSHRRSQRKTFASSKGRCFGSGFPPLRGKKKIMYFGSSFYMSPLRNIFLS